MDTVKMVIEVVAGVIPGTPMSEHTKRWSITSKQWDEAGDTIGILVSEMLGQAQGYAAYLMNPQRVNWVRCDWVWM